MQERQAKLHPEVLAARVLGVGMPLAETLRRRLNFDDLPAYVDDFLMGALLLCAARAASKGQAAGRALLAGAWGVVVGAMYYSVFGQLDNGALPDISGLPNALVVGIKLLTFCIAVLGFALSVRRCPTSAVQP